VRRYHVRVVSNRFDSLCKSDDLLPTSWNYGGENLKFSVPEQVHSCMLSKGAYDEFCH
jgi:hypothetical protein